MIIVLGSTGHVGSAVVGSLLAAEEQILVVTRDGGKADRWRTRGAEAAVVVVGDADALRAVFRRGRRAILLKGSHRSTDDPGASIDDVAS
ncbi:MULTISPECIES: NAD-dependent epimerase/dehydratase family protein [unclassified Aureimonas]|uniref:NAD-dependent epimerase/dehydratase family protein n=1 Tax=unclassified Aureimonas TaxID=2615206 RepID=UPI00070085A8|nr:MULTISPECIES: NAD-dependent epimerase/dehydratase family protein [unclassified Aureimonas]KQT62592.1 hypothetical protein ASG62_23040 [Aureimonas sp. Leaf427]KQT73183.1 hypothetical protein ASG54_17995 [Aureimonas sp. Leaf460]